MFKRIIKNRIFVRHTAFVPAYKAPVQEDFDKLREFLIKNKQLLVLTGAGISTESGWLKKYLSINFYNCV